MSVDSKAFVTTDKSNFQAVASSVTNALNMWIREKLDKAVEASEYMNRLHYIHNNDDYTNGVRVQVTDDFQYYQIMFTVAGENRMLGMFTDCDCDVKYLTEDPVFLFSIGHWGLSEEIMTIVCHALSEFGDVYWDKNDCDDIDYELVSK